MLVSNYPNVSINIANPPTELARRDAVRRDLFVPVAEAEKSAAEKPVVTDERARPAGNQASVNLYDANGKETETQQAVAGREQRQNGQQQDGNSEQQDSQQQAKQKETKQQEARQQQVEQQEQQQIQELKSRDQEVKTHEQAHAAIGGRYAGAPSYSYERGPDGKQYAVAGEVQIDIAPIPGDPQATVQKMQQVRSAALAPAEPSSADRRIAAEALQRQMQAQAELVQQQAATATAASANNASRGAEQSANADQPFSEQQVQTDISYNISDDAASSAIVVPQRDTLAITAQMELRRNVIAGFYQRATEPQFKQSLQQA